MSCWRMKSRSPAPCPAASGKVLRKVRSARHQFRPRRVVDAIAARLQNGVVAARHQRDRHGFGRPAEPATCGAASVSSRRHQPVDRLETRRTRDPESRRGGRHLVILSAGDPVFLAGLLAREQLLVFPRACLSWSRTGSRRNWCGSGSARGRPAPAPGPDRWCATSAAVQPLQHDLHAVRALRHRPALRKRRRAASAQAAAANAAGSLMHQREIGHHPRIGAAASDSPRKRPSPSALPVYPAFTFSITRSRA